MHTFKNTTTTTRFKFITLSAAAALALTAACSSDDVAEEATFGGETEIQQEMLAAVATGQIIQIAAFFGAVFASAEGDCPATEVRGPDITVTGGGCTDEDGNTYTGTIELTNVSADFFGERPDPSADTSTTYNNFNLASPTVSLTFDGTLSGGSLDANGLNLIEVDLSMESAGTNPDTGERIDTKLRVTLDALCDGAVCTYQDNSLGEVRDIGSFGIEGTYGNGSIVTLTGTNTMTVEPDPAGGECVAIKVDGTQTGNLCPDDA